MPIARGSVFKTVLSLVTQDNQILTIYLIIFSRELIFYKTYSDNPSKSVFPAKVGAIKVAINVLLQKSGSLREMCSNSQAATSSVNPLQQICGKLKMLCRSMRLIYHQILFRSFLELQKINDYSCPNEILPTINKDLIEESVTQSLQENAFRI